MGFVQLGDDLGGSRCGLPPAEGELQKRQN